MVPIVCRPLLQGSPLELHDLYRAGIERASSAVLFTNARPSSDSEQSADMLLDADTICMYRLMCTENPELEVVCELVSRNNVTFLSNHTQDDDTLLLAPPFAAGHVYTPAMLDILLCQAWYNPHVRPVSLWRYLHSAPCTYAAARSELVSASFASWFTQLTAD